MEVKMLSRVDLCTLHTTMNIDHKTYICVGRGYEDIY
jgi:hypothetical protein